MAVVLSVMIGGLGGHAASNAAAFMDNPWGASADAMGGALTADSGRIDAFFINPAGLVGVSQSNLQFTSYRQLITNYTTLLWAVPYKSGTVGLGYVSAVTDLSMETTIGNGGDVVATGGSFNYVGQGLVFSMAHPVAARLDVGASITWIQESMYGYQANGRGVDVGAIWRSPWLASKRLAWGLSVRHAVRPQLTWNTPSGASADMPRRVQLGMRVSPTPEWLLTTDIQQIEGYDSVLLVGSEYQVLPFLPLRIGWQPAQLSVGLGLCLNAFMQVNVSLATPLKNKGKHADLDVVRLSIATVF
jgi:hypothetical protein